MSLLSLECPHCSCLSANGDQPQVHSWNRDAFMNSLIPWLEDPLQGQDTVRQVRKFLQWETISEGQRATMATLWDIPFTKFNVYHEILLQEAGLVAKDKSGQGMIFSFYDDKDFVLLAKFQDGLAETRRLFPECSQLFDNYIQWMRQLYLELCEPGIMMKVAPIGNSAKFMTLRLLGDLAELIVYNRTPTGYEMVKQTMLEKKDLLISSITWLKTTFNLNEHGGLCPKPLSTSPISSVNVFAHKSYFDQKKYDDFHWLLQEANDSQALLSRIAPFFNRIDSLAEIPNMVAFIKFLLQDDRTTRQVHSLLHPNERLDIDHEQMRIRFIESLSSPDSDIQARISSLVILYEKLSQPLQSLQVIRRLKLNGVMTANSSVSIDARAQELLQMIGANDVSDLMAKILQGTLVISAEQADRFIDECKPFIDAFNSTTEAILAADKFRIAKNIQNGKALDLESTVIVKRNWNERFSDPLICDAEQAQFQQKPLYKSVNIWHLLQQCESENNLSILLPGGRLAILTTLLYLDGLITNYEQVLQAHAAVKAQMDGHQSLLHFGDAVLALLPAEKQRLLEGSFATLSSSYLISSLIRLRSETKAGSQRIIEGSQVEELLRLLITFNAAAYFSDGKSPIHGILIKEMKIGQRLFLPGLVISHAITYEIVKLAEDSYRITLINSGGGIDRHDKREFVFQTNEGEHTQMRYLYYQQFIIDFEGLEKIKFLTADSISHNEISDRFLSKTDMIDVSSRLETESVSAQKGGTCPFKSLAYLVKWFFTERDEQGKKISSNAKYDWFKTWLLADRIQEMNDHWGTRLQGIPFAAYDKLSPSWNIPESCRRVCTFEPSSDLKAPIIRHAVLRRLSLARSYKQPAESHVVSMMELLEKVLKIEKDEKLTNCYQCIRPN